MKKRTIGDLSEEEVVQYMVDRGYQILERNYNVPSIGEVDIISQKDDLLIFTEVKARSSEYFGYPSDFVDANKQRKIMRASEVYILYHASQHKQVRFDVAEVYLDQSHHINYIENAFPL